MIERVEREREGERERERNLESFGGMGVLKGSTWPSYTAKVMVTARHTRNRRNHLPQEPVLRLQSFAKCVQNAVCGCIW